LTKHLKDKGCEGWLNLPYVPNARMDRVKNNDEVFTLKAFADTINWLGFEEVRISNPHSTVSEALFDHIYVDFNCVYGDVKHILQTSLTKIDVLYFPDEGACKRYSVLLAPLGLPVAFGIKKRDWKTGKILGIDIAGYDELEGKNILMVDDICAYGGTFYYSACALKDKGANDISCYVTHLENSVMDKEKGKLIQGELIKTIYATNSIFRGVASHKIKIIREF
jgi:ribose-phosphate pyrophosphokinase